MDDAFLRAQFLEGSECFQFEKVWVGEHFEVAAEIGIARSSNDRSAFYEQITVPVIGAPASRVIDAAHLFFEAAGWFGELFFFSSRRRHTRFDCDWSSDVCSSD